MVSQKFECGVTELRDSVTKYIITNLPWYGVKYINTTGETTFYPFLVFLLTPPLGAAFGILCPMSMYLILLLIEWQKIHREGGRKIGILTLGPLGCFPRLRLANVAAGGNGECLEQATALVKLHNPLLSQKLQLLQKQLKGFKYSYFDFFTVYTETIQNPPKYGMFLNSSFAQFHF